MASPRRARKGLEIAHADDVGAGAGARGKAVLVFAAVLLQRRELLLHFDQVPFGGAHPFGAFALGARRDLLDDIEPLGAFHTAAFCLGVTDANSWRRAFTASVCVTRCSMGCMRNFCIAGHSSMAVSMRGSLPFW
jgi:hypothetical protein